jgi:hypothetical protein
MTPSPDASLSAFQYFPLSCLPFISTFYRRDHKARKENNTKNLCGLNVLGGKILFSASLEIVDCRTPTVKLFRPLVENRNRRK